MNQPHYITSHRLIDILEQQYGLYHRVNRSHVWDLTDLLKQQYDVNILYRIYEEGYELHQIDENTNLYMPVAYLPRRASCRMYYLSQQNCDEIFRVVDVEKLADYHFSMVGNEGISSIQSFKIGFDKAIELNKDKVFTVEDIKKAYIQGKHGGKTQAYVEFDDLIQSLQQPTEIEVDIEMECKIGCEHLVFNGENSLCCGNKVPKLDSEGCLILKPKE